MKKTNKFLKNIYAFAFISLFFAQNQLPGWGNAIKIAGQEGINYRLPQVCYSPTGKLYIVYWAGTKIHLSSYDGSSVKFEKAVSESSQVAYESAMWINKRGVIHVVWIEAASYVADTQYVKYRSYSGSSWSPITELKTLSLPGTVPGGFVTRKVENMHIAADESGNVFITFMIWPAARCQFISKFGSTSTLESWPMSGRSKHPGVAVDSNYVHVAWQQLWGNIYTIGYCRRSNSLYGKWETVIDVKDGIHRPEIAVDPNRVPHVFYMDDTSTARNNIYKYWTGKSFSQKFITSDDKDRKYINLGLAVFDSSNVFTMSLLNGGPSMYYNWKQNGNWSGHRLVNNTRPNPDDTATTLSPNGKTAVIAYSDKHNSIYINLSTEGPTPPEPPIPNDPPKAFFSLAPTSGLYPLTVNFNAGNSTDPDGQIVSYKWIFGDGATGSGKIVNHAFQRQGVFSISLKVTDDDGATASATGSVQVFGIVPPLNLQYKRIENRNLFFVEYLYRITWDANPRNEEVGAKIVAYKIYRREKGHIGFAPFVNIPVGNQSKHEYLDRTLGSVARQYDYLVTSIDSVGRESDWE